MFTEAQRLAVHRAIDDAIDRAAANMARRRRLSNGSRWVELPMGRADVALPGARIVTPAEIADWAAEFFAEPVP